MARGRQAEKEGETLGRVRVPGCARTNTMTLYLGGQKQNSGNGFGPFPLARDTNSLLRGFGGKMPDRVAGSDFQSIKRAARPLCGEAEASFGKIDALQPECPKCVADTDDGHHHQEAHRKKSFSDDEFADEINLENQQDYKSSEQRAPDSRLLRRFHDEAFRLCYQFFHDP
jgi:hypothetical protein